MSEATMAGALMTPDDVAGYLAISGATFRRLRAKGAFPGPDVTLGPLIRWRPSTVDRWIEGHPSSRPGGPPAYEGGAAARAT